MSQIPLQSFPTALTVMCSFRCNQTIFWIVRRRSAGSLSSLAMMMAPPTGGLLLQYHWLDAWPLVAAGVALIGLLVCLAVGRVASVAAASTLPKAELHSEA